MLAIVGAGFVVLRARRPFLARFRSDVDGLVSPERIGETLEALAKSRTARARPRTPRSRTRSRAGSGARA